MNDVIVLNFVQIIFLLIIIAMIFYKYLPQREITDTLIIGTSFGMILVYTIFELGKEIYEREDVVYPFYVAGMRTFALLFMGYAMFYRKYGGRVHKYSLEIILTIGIILNLMIIAFIVKEYTALYKKWYVPYDTYWGTNLLRSIQLSFLILFSFISFKLWLNNKTRTMLLITIGFILWAISIFLLIALQLSITTENFITQFILTISYLLLGYVSLTGKQFLLDIVPTSDSKIKVVEIDKKEEIVKILKDRGFFSITKGILLFKELLKEGAEGLIMTKEEPKFFRDEYEIERTPIIWLTPNAETEEIWCNPRKLNIIRVSINGFVEKSKNPIVLIDMKYLIQYNRKHQKEILDFALFLFSISQKALIFTIGEERKKLTELSDINILNPIIIEDILNTVIQPEKQKEEIDLLNKEEPLIKYDGRIVLNKSILRKENFERIIKTILTHFEKNEQIKNKIIEKLEEYRIKTSVFKLKKGENYLASIDEGFKLFADYKYAKKLCLTRTSPESINKKYNLTDVSFKWLSTIEGENNISPTDLARILSTIKNFVYENKDYIILINGFDYLVFQNGIESTIKTIELINEINTINKGLVIYLTDKRLMKQYSTLIREMNIIN